MTDLNAIPLDELFRYLAREGWVTRLIELARDEDLGPGWDLSGPGGGDVTSMALVLGQARARGLIVARRAGIVSGLVLVPQIFHAFRVDADFVPAKGIDDGSPVEAGTLLGSIVGNQRGMLAAERTVLNFLGRLSGIATRTAEHAAMIKHTTARLFDTRKTTPGLRALEKYAVRCGGGHCHRLGLYDAALIKDNHLAGVSDTDLPNVVIRAARSAREEAPREGLRFIELEVDTMAQFESLLAAASRGDPVFGSTGVQVVLLDNFAPADLRKAVELRNAAKATALLEASGGISAQNLAEVAETGVDRISLGTLTHGATWLDIALDVEGPTRF